MKIYAAKCLWHIALTTSFLVHVSIFTGIPAFKRHDTQKIIDKQNDSDKKKIITINPKKIEKIKIPPQEQLSRSLIPKPLPYVDELLNQVLKKGSLSTLEKSNFTNKTAKEIILSEIPQDRKLKENPVYMDYYRSVREKIRSSIYSTYDSNKQGIISIRFMIQKNGSLTEVEVDPETQSDHPLRTVALKSMDKAAPFPSFPRELQDYESLPFNISIYFKK